VGATVAVASASNAHAADQVVATFARSDIPRSKIVAGGAVLQCEQNQCVAEAPNYRTLSLETCKLLAKHLGRVETFGEGTRRSPLRSCKPARAGQSSRWVACEGD
jgi:hypothetical protein